MKLLIGEPEDTGTADAAVAAAWPCRRFEGAVITMTAMPPEPDFRNLPPPPAFPPPVYPPPDQYAPRRRRAFSVVRIACGALWAAFTIILAAGTVMEWLTGLHAASIMCFVFAVGCGWYDYRIWTFKARRLWFLSEGAPTQRPILAPVPRRRPDRHRNIAGW